MSLGGVSKEFHLYHGTGLDMTSPILVDDFELVRYEPKTSSDLAVWDATGNASKLDWSLKSSWLPVEDATHVFTGVPVTQGGQVAGSIRKSDGALVVYALGNGEPKQRCRLRTRQCHTHTPRPEQ